MMEGNTWQKRKYCLQVGSSSVSGTTCMTQVDQLTQKLTERNSCSTRGAKRFSFLQNYRRTRDDVTFSMELIPNLEFYSQVIHPLPHLNTSGFLTTLSISCGQYPKENYASVCLCLLPWKCCSEDRTRASMQNLLTADLTAEKKNNHGLCGSSFRLTWSS